MNRRTNQGQRFLRARAALLAALFLGCAEVPDHCAGYGLACLGVSVDSGPDGVYRLQVSVNDGLDTSTTSTTLTPKHPPAAPLVYPLRFGIFFAQFADYYQGMTSLTIRALDADFIELGEVSTTVAITGHEKKNLDVVLGPVVVTPDMAPGLPDESAADLLSSPDMP
jgi:hypothetical protein